MENPKRMIFEREFTQWIYVEPFNQIIDLGNKTIWEWLKEQHVASGKIKTKMIYVSMKDEPVDGQKDLTETHFVKKNMSSNIMYIVSDRQIWSSYMTIIYDHHMCRSLWSS